jgi:hypothetical protein
LRQRTNTKVRQDGDDRVVDRRELEKRPA